MKKLKLFCLIIALLGLIPASSVWARGGHGGGHHFGGGHHYGGHHFGGFGLGYGYGWYEPYYGGPYYGGPYYGGYGRYGLGYDGYGYGDSYPPPVMYIQQQDGAQTDTRAQTNYWYYCNKPEGYYPHVKKCPDGWMQVVPQSPAQ